MTSQNKTINFCIILIIHKFQTHVSHSPIFLELKGDISVLTIQVWPEIQLSQVRVKLREKKVLKSIKYIPQKIKALKVSIQLVQTPNPCVILI